MGYNIQQENKYTLKDKARRSAPEGYYLPGANDTIPQYISAVSGKDIIKLGYCCEPKGHIYPIFLKVQGIYRMISINKNGIYEMQPESWTDSEMADAEAQQTNTIVTEILVPDGIDFTLEYVTSIT